MIYVMSDIHGNKDRFDNVMEQIDLKAEDTLYILGDVIDRYPYGIRLLRQIMKASNIKMLLGNHEYMMLEALYHPATTDDKFIAAAEKQWRLDIWYDNNGEITHNSLKRLKKETRQEILEFLDSLPLNIPLEVNGQKYLLIHGRVAKNFDRLRSSFNDEVSYAVWGRDTERESIPDDTIVIFGHTPTTYYQSGKPMKIWKCGNYIDIDCGCGFGSEGRLCCLRLDDMKVYYSEL